jgi:hypothetical protein
MEVFPTRETSVRYLHQETARCRRVVVVLQFPLGQRLQVCFQATWRLVRQLLLRAIVRHTQALSYVRQLLQVLALGWQ